MQSQAVRCVCGRVPAVSTLLCEAVSLSGLQMTVPWESEEKWLTMDSWCECECLYE